MMLLLIFLLCFFSEAKQDYFCSLNNSDTILVYKRYLGISYRKTKLFNNRCERNRKKYFRNLRSAEEKIKTRLDKVNPRLSNYLYGLNYKMNAPYLSQVKSIKNKLQIQSNSPNIYFAYFDTLKNSIRYLNSNADSNQFYSPRFRKKLRKAEKEITRAEKNIIESNSDNAFIRQRKIILKNALQKYPELDDELLSFKKGAYYNLATFDELKQTFKDPTSIENNATKFLLADFYYRNFITANSDLSSFAKSFPKSGGSVAFSSMQTTIQTGDLMQHSIKNLGPDAKHILESNMAEMHSSLSKAKTQFSSLENLADLPEFKINPLKTKPFFERVKFGFDLHFSPGTLFVPVSGEFGVHAGYQISQRTIAGGTSFYRVGFGDGVRNIVWSHEGLSYGTYAEHNLKRIIFAYITFERKYYYDVSYRNESLDKSTWKNSLMAGFKLKTQNKKKRSYCVSLLYDFMHELQIPFTPALTYRVGWEF